MCGLAQALREALRQTLTCAASTFPPGRGGGVAVAGPGPGPETGDRAQWTAYVLREFAAELGLARTPTR